MKRIDFDFENMGGLAELYAIPPSDVLRLRHDYLYDIDNVELVTRQNIVAVPVYGNRSFSFSEQSGIADGGRYWDVSIEGVIPKIQNGSSHIIEKLERGTWLVLSMDHNGIVHLSGSVEVPLVFSAYKSTGDACSSLNGSTFSFTGRQPKPSVIIDLDELTNI